MAYNTTTWTTDPNTKADANTTQSQFHIYKSITGGFDGWSSNDTTNIIFLNYDDQERTSEMYISGAYFCVKKDFLLENPLDEALTWGQGEDVEWCRVLRERWTYRCNKRSKVNLLKLKGNTHWYEDFNESARREWDEANSP